MQKITLCQYKAKIYNSAKNVPRCANNHTQFIKSLSYVRPRDFICSFLRKSCGFWFNSLDIIDSGSSTFHKTDDTTRDSAVIGRMVYLQAKNDHNSGQGPIQNAHDEYVTYHRYARFWRLWKFVLNDGQKHNITQQHSRDETNSFSSFWR